jgi:hypothetical protein
VYIVPVAFLIARVDRIPKNFVDDFGWLFVVVCVGGVLLLKRERFGGGVVVVIEVGIDVLKGSLR